MTFQAGTSRANIARPFRRIPHPRLPVRVLWQGLIFVSLVVILWTGYVWTGRPLTLVINDRSYQIRTHRQTVGTALHELDLTLTPEDVVQPPLDTPLAPGTTITIELARPVTIEADGRTRQLLTRRNTVAEALAQAGIVTNPRDEVLLNGAAVNRDEALALPPLNPRPVSTDNVVHLLLRAYTPRGAFTSARPEKAHLIVHRAVPVTLHDGRVASTFYTTRLNVGEALLEQGIIPFLGDKVTPSLGARLSPGMKIYIQRSKPVTIVADGRTIKTRTRRKTIGELLAQEQISLMGQDYSRPPADALIAGQEVLEVVRVREASEVEEEFIPFETSWISDETMELDRQEVRQTGQTGVIKTRTRVRYENEQEIWRRIEDKWQDQEASDRIIAYGTNIVIRTLDTPDGPVEYWRRISMLSTPYTAATSGKAPDHPRYGITRSGLQVRYGMAAVDPKVIPLMTNLYVPGYGPALAADTGGLIVGKHIDLAYEEDQQLPDLYDWRDVYVLTPVPPPDKIRYVLPEWPQR